MSDKQDKHCEASSISSLPVKQATKEHIHASCWRQNMNACIRRGSVKKEVDMLNQRVGKMRKHEALQ